MEKTFMTLKILLPFKVFAEIKDVKKMVIETTAGSYGLLPQRLDGAAALEPGILLYETAAGDVKYIAVDEGIMVKAGFNVWVSVRNAIGGAPLGKLRTLVEEKMTQLSEKEVSARTVMAKLESGFIHNFQKLIKKS